MNTQIVTMSTKGQVALPVSLRREMGIESGAKFVAFAADDTIMLKMIRLPTPDDFRRILDQAQVWADENGLTETEVSELIKASRSGKR